MKKPLPLFIALVFLFQFISAQSHQWSMGAGGTQGDGVVEVLVTSSDQLLVTGNFSGTMDVDRGPGVTTLTATGSQNAFISCYSASGSLVWARSLEGTGGSSGDNLAVDDLGNIYLAGSFYGTADLDPGAGVFNINSWGTSDAFIVKLDASGNFLWGGQIYASDNARINDIAWDGTNLVYCGGSTGLLDLDPAPATTVSFPMTGSGNGFVGKCSAAGTYIWGLTLGGTGITETECLKATASGDLWVGGVFTTSIDLDPGAGTANYVSMGVADGFVLKLNSSGNYLWGGTVGSVGSDGEMRMDMDAMGNLYFGGIYTNTFDLDPGTGVTTVTSTGISDCYLAKLDASGVLQWGRSIGGIDYDKLSQIAVDSVGNLYATGNFKASCDFDPGPGTFTLAPLVWGPSANWDYFVVMLDPAGNFDWAASGGGLHSDLSYAIDNWRNGDLVMGGDFTQVTDADPSTGIASYAANTTVANYKDFFLAVWRPDSCALLTVVTNASDDISCISGSGMIDLSAWGGLAPYSYSWSTGATVSSISPTVPGTYSVTLTDANSCSTTSTYLISGPSTPGSDLAVNLSPTTMRGGFPATLTLDVYNLGCASTSGMAELVMDPSLTITSISPAPVSISGDTLRWNFSSLSFGSGHFIAFIGVIVPASAPIGSLICFDATATPLSGDIHPFDNVHTNQCFPVVLAFDPNDKQVWPQGECAERYVVAGTPLTYTVRFQNTGNYEALNVFILDTLDSDLNLGTVKVKSASHNMYTTVTDGNVLRFVFDNIHLPDSSSDEPGSHGYVVYEVTPDVSLPSGTMIQNRASIYFDYNEPVLTNMVTNTMVTTIPPCAVGILDPSGENVMLTLHPNPASDLVNITCSEEMNEVTAVNAMGQQVLTCKLKGSHEYSLDVSSLPAGIYILYTRSGDNTWVRKLQVR